MIDMFSISSEDDFDNIYAQKIIKATSNKAEEWLSATRQFLKKISPRISLGVDQGAEFDLSFDFEDSLVHEEVLDLPEKVAKSRGINLVVCLDEFQNIEFFHDPLIFQKKLRAIIQKHTHVTYIFYGSKRHMMTNLFKSRGMLFYKFGEVIFLDKIKLEHWRNFLSLKFDQTGKHLNNELADNLSKEAVDRFTGKVELIDPLFGIWLLKVFNANN